MSQNIFGGFAGKVAAAAIGVGTTAAAVNSCLVNIDAGHRGVLFTRISGVQDTPLAEGTHFYIPFFQNVTPFDVRARPKMITTKTGTKDLQNAHLKLRVISHPDEEKVAEIYKQFNVDYEERLIPGLGSEVLKAVVAQYNAEQLLTLREDVSAEIRSSLRKRCADFNVLLDDVALVHIDFSTEFMRSIESKQVAQQESERSKLLVERAEQEKEAAIILAEGEAEAARLVSEAMAEHGEGLIEIRRIETAREIAATLARSRNVTYLPNSGVLFNIPAQ